MTTAVFPGSFDPPTYGHLNIIERASRLFDKIDVLISVNPDKKCLFSDKERYDLLIKLTENYKNVTVHIWNTLVADYCRKSGANVLIRGVRNAMDFSHEFDLSLMNKHLNSDVETLLIPTAQKYFLVRSSSIKEVARFGGDISTMVPKIVETEMKKKFFEQNSVSK
ncbi:MAG: pantetheine-phosphate adenylyltransferase [Spirochaetales bacterium]|nr:pantetheine-phosphate adenylyltransferase [Spirochaetales bacterium]